MSDETTLLSCPFCGGEAKVIQADHPSYTPHGEGWYSICKCGATLGYHGTDELYMTYGDFASKLGAIAAWNIRATHGTLTAELVEKIVDRNCEWYEGGEIDAQAIVDELNAELGSGTCNPVETATLENTTAHVMECDMCGCTYEHVNGDYEHCPRCGKAVER